MWGKVHIATWSTVDEIWNNVFSSWFREKTNSASHPAKNQRHPKNPNFLKGSTSCECGIPKCELRQSSQNLSTLQLDPPWNTREWCPIETSEVAPLFLQKARYKKSDILRPLGFVIQAILPNFKTGNLHFRTFSSVDQVRTGSSCNVDLSHRHRASW